MKLKCAFVLVILFLIQVAHSKDWPIYKGNIYYTGNNDEITVKNNNLKWLYQARSYVYNPIVSDGKVYFFDLKKNIYCLNEDTGKLIWLVSLRKISSQFSAFSRAFGKIKYPLIKGNYIFLTDNIAVYCLNKNNGRVLWARTGRRHDRSMDNIRRWKFGESRRWKSRFRFRSRYYNPRRSSRALVDSIYANPVIYDNYIYYGTRNVFVSRDIFNGHLKWKNSSIKSFSGFPSFYDKYLLTQSMNYSTLRFTLYCLVARTGQVKWQKRLPRPFKIYSPVVYKKKIYLALTKSLYCMHLKTGKTIWKKQFSNYITSNPSFTEREILFVVGNRRVVIVDPKTGKKKREIDLGFKSSPYFVTIRDHIYIAHNFKKTVGGRKITFTTIKGLLLKDGGRMWQFKCPFPGGTHQQVASKGIMFQPAGNYLYAIGTDYYPRIIKGGSAYYGPYGKIRKRDPKDKDKDRRNNQRRFNKKRIPMRKMKITIKDKDDNRTIRAHVDIKKWKQGKIIYSKRVPISKPGQIIDVPDMNDVEITAHKPDYVPKKVIVSRKNNKKVIRLDRILEGKKIIVENIHFEFDKAYLTKETLNILDRMIAAMKWNRRIKLEVRGHTDSVGNAVYNKKLSERRADAVVEYMVKNGISPVRLRAKGFGESNPIASNSTVKGRSKNRRTEFLILKN